MFRAQGTNTEGQVHSREEQNSCRHLDQARPGSGDRMVIGSSSSEHTLQIVGGSHSGFVRHFSESQTILVMLSSPRQKSRSPGRLSASL